MKKIVFLFAIIFCCKNGISQGCEFRYVIIKATYQYEGEKVNNIADSMVKDKLVTINFLAQKIQIFKIPFKAFTLVDIAPSFQDENGKTDVVKAVDELNNGCRIYLTRPFNDKEMVTMGVQYSTITYIYWLKDL